MGSFTVVHVPERQRYEIREGETVVGYASARPSGGRVYFPHVEVAPAYRGQNVANDLVRAALDDVRARGERIVAQCPFVVAFLRRNPAYGDLQA
jgi:predicted GNAT family acetyltransferase